MPTVFTPVFFAFSSQITLNKRLTRTSWLNLQNFLFLNVLEVAIITLIKNMQIQIFLWTFPVYVPNTGDNNDVIYLTRA